MIKILFIGGCYMSRWEGPIDFEKYYGKRNYKDL